MRGRALIVAFGALMALMAAGYGVLFTMLDDFRDEYGIAESALGAVIGIGFFSGFAAQVLIAPLADRGFARRLVVTGGCLDVVGLLMMASASSIVPLLLGRFVMGVGVGMAVPAVRRIVILADHANLGRNLGRLLSMEVAGFALGPAVAAVLPGSLGIPAPFLVIAGATVLVLPFAASVTVEESVATSGQQRFAFDLLRHRPFAGAVALGCAVFLMIGAFDALWAVVLADLGTSEWVADVGITLFALPLVIFGSTGGRWAQRVGPFRLGTVGLLGGAVCMLAYGLVPGGAMLAVAVVHAVNDGLTVSSTGVAAGLTVEPERQAGAQGVLGGFQTLTAGITAIATGVLYEHFGRTVAYAVSAAAMLALVGIGVRLAGPAWHLRGARPDVPPDVPAPAVAP